MNNMCNNKCKEDNLNVFFTNDFKCLYIFNF